MLPRETENNVMQTFGVTNKEHYGVLWYFLKRSIGVGLVKSLNQGLWLHIWMHFTPLNQ